MTSGLRFVRAELTLCRETPRRTMSGSADGEDYPAEPTSTSYLPTGVTAIVRLTPMAQRPGAQASSLPAETSSTPANPTDEHIVADLDVADAASLGIADVIIHYGGSALPAPRHGLARIFARHPGCAVVACPSGGHHLVGVRDGRSIALVLRSIGCRHAEKGDMNATAMCASLVHIWVASGRSLDALGSVAVVTVRRHPWAGWVSYRVDRVLPAGAASLR